MTRINITRNGDFQIETDEELFVIPATIIDLKADNIIDITYGPTFYTILGKIRFIRNAFFKIDWQRTAHQSKLLIIKYRTRKSVDRTLYLFHSSGKRKNRRVIYEAKSSWHSQFLDPNFLDWGPRQVFIASHGLDAGSHQEAMTIVRVVENDRADDLIVGTQVSGPYKQLRVSAIDSHANQKWTVSQFQIPIGFKFSISELICARFSTNFADFLQRSNHCSPISKKVADSMVRVAATRIFADPYQSIMEIPVNSIDSYRRMRDPNIPSVGKFGMGFFSILYWLIDNPNRHLIIDSKRDDQQFILAISHENDGYVGQFVDDRYMTNIKKAFEINESGELNLLTESKHGTTVYLVDNGASETWFRFNLTSSGFQRQLKRLKYITDVRLNENLIYGEHDKLFHKHETINSTKGIMDEVLIQFTSSDTKNKITGICIRDAAEGISLDTVFNSLLIPSISSKTIDRAQRLEDPYYENKTGIVNTYKSSPKNGLFITVGNIVIVSILAGLIRTARFIYRLDFPIYAKLPVARDDVVIRIDSIEYTIMFDGFTHLVNSAIERGHDLENLFVYVREYRAYSKQDTVDEIIDLVEKNSRQREDVIYMASEKSVRILRRLRELSPASSRIRKYHITRLNHSPIMVNNERLNIVLSTMSNITLDNTFRNITIVVLPENINGYVNITDDMNVLDVDMPSFLFITNDFYRNPNWRDNLVLSYTKSILYRRDELHYTRFSVGYLRQLIRARYRDQSMWVPLLVYSSKHEVFNTIDINQLNHLYQILDTKIKRLIRVDSNSDIIPRNFLPVLTRIMDFAIISNSNASEYIAQLSQAIGKAVNNVSEGNRLRGYLIRPLFFNYLSDYIENRVHKWLYAGNVVTMNMFLDKISQNARETLLEGYFTAIWINLDDNNVLKSDEFQLYKMEFSPLTVALGWYVMCANKFSSDYDSVPGIIYILNNMRTAYEAGTILMVLIYTMLNDVFIKVRPDMSMIKYLVNEVHSRYSIDFFHEMSTYTHDDIVKYEQVYYNPMKESVKLYIQHMETQSSIQLSQHPSISNAAYSFTANQLIDYTFSTGINKIDNVPNHDSLRKLLHRVSQHRLYLDANRPQFQTVSIAVNEGTTKPFVASILTELLQNSIDAIRSNISTVERRIDLTSGYMNESVFFTIQDYVGIPDSALLSLWIPFLSGKSTDDLMSTGEMGTGFFNVYRQPNSSLVIIQTGDLVIHAKPMLTGDRVTDISYEVAFNPRNVIEGTRITIFTNSLSIDARIDLLIDIGLFANGVLSLSPFDTYYNDHQVNLTQQLIYETDVGSVYVMTERQVQSYLTTNGVPMMKLEPYLKNLIYVDHVILHMGVVIDIKKGHYQPVHSRSHFGGSVDESLRLFMIKAVFYAITYKLPTDRDVIFNQYLNQGTSLSNLDQLVFYDGGYMDLYANSELGIQFHHFTYPKFSFQDDIKLTTIIHHIIEYYATVPTVLPTKAKIYHLIDEYARNLGGENNVNWSIIKPVIRRWFKSKRNYTSCTKAIIDRTVDESKKLDHDLANLIEFFTKFIKAYYAVGSQLKITGINFDRGAPSLIAEDIEGLSGYYSPLLHQIVLRKQSLAANFGSLNQGLNRIKHLHKTKSIAELTNYLYVSPLANWIGNIIPMSILVHELQHSILSTDHRSSEAHPQRIIDGVVRDFNAGATYVYGEILMNGLWNDIL